MAKNKNIERLRADDGGAEGQEQRPDAIPSGEMQEAEMIINEQADRQADFLRKAWNDVKERFGAFAGKVRGVENKAEKVTAVFMTLTFLGGVMGMAPQKAEAGEFGREISRDIGRGIGEGGRRALERFGEGIGEKLYEIFSGRYERRERERDEEWRRRREQEEYRARQRRLDEERRWRQEQARTGHRRRYDVGNTFDRQRAEAAERFARQLERAKTLEEREKAKRDFYDTLSAISEAERQSLGGSGGASAWGRHKSQRLR